MTATCRHIWFTDLNLDTYHCMMCKVAGELIDNEIVPKEEATNES